MGAEYPQEPEKEKDRSELLCLSFMFCLYTVDDVKRDLARRQEAAGDGSLVLPVLHVIFDTHAKTYFLIPEEPETQDSLEEKHKNFPVIRCACSCRMQ